MKILSYRQFLFKMSFTEIHRTLNVSEITNLFPRIFITFLFFLLFINFSFFCHFSTQYFLIVFHHVPIFSPFYQLYFFFVIFHHYSSNSHCYSSLFIIFRWFFIIFFFILFHRYSSNWRQPTYQPTCNTLTYIPTYCQRCSRI